jgi:hypothetical protein
VLVLDLDKTVEVIGLILAVGMVGFELAPIFYVILYVCCGSVCIGQLFLFLLRNAV